jgi:hypothetical protein
MFSALSIAAAVAAGTGDGASYYAAIGLPSSPLPSGIEQAIGAVQKSESNPLFVQDKPWEPRLDNGYPNVVYDSANTEGHGVWKVWYGDCVKGCSTQILLFANSTDGLSWEKPDLGLFDMGSVRSDLKGVGKANNAVLKGGGIGIYRDDHEKNPAARYKAFGSGCYGPGGTTDCIGGTAVSADGFSFTNISALKFPAPQRYDCHSNVIWDPKQNDYIATTRDGFSHGSGRDIGIARSLPGEFKFDTSKAPALVEQGTPAAQLYSQITWPWNDVYLGIVMVFDATSPAGHVHCRLSWSADARHWSWVDPAGLTGADFVPAGAAGSFDSHICFAAARPVELESEHRIYYMGGNGPHNGARNSSFGLATLGLDRFAGLAGTGTVVTRAVLVTGKTLMLTADVKAGGSLQVGSTDVAGLGPSDATPITASVTRSAVTFSAGKDFAAFIGKTVSLTIKLTDATVYAIGFA